MKKIVNKLRFALLLGFVAMSVTAWSQAVPYINKMSITTRMFLNDMSNSNAMLKAKAQGQDVAWNRLYAAPEYRDGKAYVAAFIRVTNEGIIHDLKSMGVEVQSKFKNGTLLTAAIPVDALNDVASLEGVTRINVSPVVQVESTTGRVETNADDVLLGTGLTSAFDGTGVILGIVDTGIDFDHVAFQDKDGNSRVVRAIVGDTEYTSVNGLTTDNSDSDHGTHVASIAGGSSVTSSYAVTTNHASATYGGMAPGADLYLAGAATTVTYIANAFDKMSAYAASVGKPLVVNNSWSMPYGPRDGSGDFAEVVSEIFSDSNPGNICLFAAANNANLASSTYGGGFYISGNASSSSPLGTIMLNETNGSSTYNGWVADAWCRTAGVDMGCTIYVLNGSSGAVVATIPVTFSSTGTTGTAVNVSSYYSSGTLTAYKDYTETVSGTRKTEILLDASSLTRSSYNNYALAVEFYPTSGSAYIDVWAGGKSSYFSNYLTTSGHTWVAGSDDMSVNNTATLPNVISVGAYVNNPQSGSNSQGDIYKYSAYAVEGTGPTGTAYPWITAPGDAVTAALNLHSSYSKYGTLSGTSQSTPVASGIVAQWMQAAKSVGKTLTTSEVKNIMAQTAIKDSWVNGSNASHFGPNGKIDALAGVQYILDNYGSSDPTIRPSATELTFACEPNSTDNQQVTVMGSNLTGSITATLNDPSNVYTVTVTSASGMRASGSTTLSAGDVLNVTYSPKAIGTHTGTITLTSDGAESKTITLNGTAAIVEEATICNGTNTNEYLPVYGWYYDDAQTNQMLYPASKLTAEGMAAGQKITSVTFFPGTYSSGYSSYSGINFYYQQSKGNGTVTIKLANMPAGTAAYASSATRKDADFTAVKTITMPSSAQTDLTDWVFDNLTGDFVYEGGDLLIEVVTEAGGYGHTYFYGENQDDYMGYYNYSSATGQKFLPKVHFTFEGTNVTPSLSVDPAEVNIEDETDAQRSADVAVTSANLTGNLTTTASTNWSATLSQDEQTLTVTYNGHALHQVGSATVSSADDELTATVATDYLYTGPIYVIGDVNNYAWNTSNGVQLTRDENGIYTGTISTQRSSDAAYISFTKQLGSSIDGYRFGPVSTGNWWLTDETTDVFCPLDTVGNVNNVRLAAGYYVITIDSRNNQFKITPAAISSSVSPNEGTLDFGSVYAGGSTSQTITITNDGDLPFTPSMSGLSGSFSTDYVPSELAPGESATITVTYSPSNVGSDSQSFTVSDGVNTHTWTLTGSATAATTHGYVDDDDKAIDFGEKTLDQTYSDKVRIYNDGDLPFSPVIDVTGLDGVFTVTPTTGITIAPGEYYDLTVYFRPTEDTNYSGSFTVTIDGVVTTVTVTGAGTETAVVDNVIRSNTVTVPVYKTGVNVLSPFTRDEIDADLDHTMPLDITNSDVMVKASRPSAITRYDLYHNPITKVSETNWAPGTIDEAVAYANHDRLSGSYLPFIKDQETWTDWVEQPVAPWLDTEASNMWLYLNDNVEVQGDDTWYVPVVVADGKVSKDNTYGAPIWLSPLCHVDVAIYYDRTNASNSHHNAKTLTDPATGIDYYYMTAEVDMECTAPVALDGAGYHYECYKARAWRQWTPYVVGEGIQPATETYMGEVALDGAQDHAVIGSKDFVKKADGSWNYDTEPAFCSPVGYEPEFIARFYYVRVDDASGSSTLRSGGAGGAGGGGAGGGGGAPGPGGMTGVSELNADKVVVDVQYVNPLGMTSSKPFDGVNIIVTRYSDGSTSTTKVLK